MDLQQLTSQQAASRQEWGKLNWMRPHTPGQIHPDEEWLDWLTDASSLTRRLRQVSQQHFHVQLLQQKLLKPALNECRLLGMATQEYALVRQVVLHGLNQPWVFARTVIPLPTLRQGNRHLMLLGNRSLGSVLFKNTHTQRTSQEITPYHADFCAPFVWGRRSTFEIRQAPLLVTELFLEPFRQHLQLQF
ncbi:chorismate lyase [Oceanospirillum linum]|nr:chorismate lyase [Oleiphilus messinensis]SMP19166.1 chorismate lyase [Oceanospirillum linum]